MKRERRLAGRSVRRRADDADWSAWRGAIRRSWLQPPSCRPSTFHGVSRSGAISLSFSRSLSTVHKAREKSLSLSSTIVFRAKFERKHETHRHSPVTNLARQSGPLLLKVRFVPSFLFCHSSRSLSRLFSVKGPIRWRTRVCHRLEDCFYFYCIY